MGLVAPQALEISPSDRRPERLIAEQRALTELPSTILVPGQNLALEKSLQARGLGTPGLRLLCRLLIRGVIILAGQYVLPPAPGVLA